MRNKEERGEPAPQLELPPVPEAVEHLVGYLFEVGPVVGEHSVPFSEIYAWRRETGVQLNEFETTAIRMLSQEYLGMRREAADAKCPAPLMRRDELPSRETVSNALGALLRSFNSPKAKADRAKRKTVRAAETTAQKKDGDE